MNTTDQAELWRFEALDTWFFKESRPLEAIGGAQLGSSFPPPARTLIGAVRTALGDAYGVQWQDYARREDHPLRALMGAPSDLGPLRFEGPYLLHQGRRLFPAPLSLLVREADDDLKQPVAFTHLRPGPKSQACDLGWVRLPRKLDALLAGAKPAEGQFLTAAGLQAVLQGRSPQATDMLRAKDLFHHEPRLGIAREHHTRRPQDGLLYQTRHVRPRAETALGMSLRGLDSQAFAGLQRQGMARVGAEGRLAAWSRDKVQPLPAVVISGQRLMLCLLTHAAFERGWLPDGFAQVTTERDGRPWTHWSGVLAGKSVRLVSAVTGKPVREGGWNLAEQKPRELRGLVPAGSCYFLELDSVQDAQQVARALHGAQWGQETAWGRGLVAVGSWS